MFELPDNVGTEALASSSPELTEKRRRFVQMLLESMRAAPSVLSALEADELRRLADQAAKLHVAADRAHEQAIAHELARRERAARGAS